MSKTKHNSTPKQLLLHPTAHKTLIQATPTPPQPQFTPIKHNSPALQTPQAQQIDPKPQIHHRIQLPHKAFYFTNPTKFTDKTNNKKKEQQLTEPKKTHQIDRFIA